MNVRIHVSHFNWILKYWNRKKNVNFSYANFANACINSATNRENLLLEFIKQTPAPAARRKKYETKQMEVLIIRHFIRLCAYEYIYSFKP